MTKTIEWNLLELGTRDTAEFQSIIAWLDQLPWIRDRWKFSTIADVFDSALDELYPDVIVIWQRFSDEFSAEDIQRLLSRYPLARIVCITGAWCAADGRTRTAWPARFRVPVEQARLRLELEFQSLAGAQVPACPWTAAVDEVWRWTQANRSLVDLSGLRVQLLIPDHALRECLRSELQSAHATVIDDSTPDADMIIVEIEPWGAVIRDRLLALQRKQPQVTLMGISGWATADLLAEYREFGIADLLHKLSPETWQQTVFDAAKRSQPVDQEHQL